MSSKPMQAQYKCPDITVIMPSISIVLSNDYLMSVVVLQVKRPPEIGLLLVPQVSMGASSSIRPVAIRLLVKYPTDYPDR